jgi:hypothetical protein
MDKDVCRARQAGFTPLPQASEGGICLMVEATPARELIWHKVSESAHVTAFLVTGCPEFLPTARKPFTAACVAPDVSMPVALN